jgi:multidrug efflux pump subunit AcrA (membrane-fusion protein)
MRAVPALSLLLLVPACSDDGDRVVEIREVGRTTVTETVDAPGTVAARASAVVAAPADVQVDQVLVQDGATVQPGAVLVRLSSPSAQERLQQARSALAAASAGRIEVPPADLGPLQDALDAAAAASFAAGRSAAAALVDPAQRAAAEQQVREAEARYAAAALASRRSQEQLDAGARGLQDALAALTAGQRLQARAAVGAAQAVVDALTVTAPIAGVVTLGGDAGAGGGGDDIGGLLDSLPEGLQEQAGAALGGGGAPAPTTTTVGLPVGSRLTSGAPLLTVTDVGGLTVTAEVDETDVLLVAAGQRAEVELDAVPGARYAATVTAVDLTPSASSGGGVVYRVRLGLAGGTTADDEPAPSPRPGMSAIVDLQVRTAPSVLAVPSAAVVRDGGEDAVFVVEDGRVQRVGVSLGAQGDELVEVRRGLAGGEQVVVRDADRLTDGQAVETSTR